MGHSTEDEQIITFCNIYTPLSYNFTLILMW